MSDYLWDKTGEPDEDVQELENLLGALMYQPRPLDIPASAMPTVKARPTAMFFSRPQLAIAASLLLMLLAGTWLVTRQRESQQQVAKATTGSETGGSRQPDKAVGTSETKRGSNDSVNNTEVSSTVASKLRDDSAGVVAVSSPKPRQAPRALIARRQKVLPRVKENLPAPQEYVAANGRTRWEVEQPLTPQQREATEQLMLALSVASAKFNYAQREMQEIGRAGK
jgi:hypothetical protein